MWLESNPGEETADLLVVGGGMAAALLLERLVDHGYAGRIALVSAERQPCYNRVLLSEVLAGERDEAELPLLEAGWYEQHGIQLWCGESVERIDSSSKTAATASRRIHYHQLVLATGASAALPGIPGVDLPGVCGFRTLDDLRQFRDSVMPGDEVVVVGGGLLGLEAAHGLRALGAGVTVVHRNRCLMNRQLDAGAAALLQSRMEDRGVGFRLEDSVRAIRPGMVVELASGAGSRASRVIFASGIQPNIQLAVDAGMDCGAAIRVDGELRTSLADCFALGECCEFEGRGFGLLAPIRRQAATLAALLCGRMEAGFSYREDAVQLKVSGIDVFAAGERSGEREQLLRDPLNGVYRRLWFRGNRLAGAVLVGERSGGNWYHELITSAEDVTDYGPQLVFGPAFCAAVGASTAQGAL